MTYLIDTNICIYIMNNRHPGIINRCREAGVGNIGVSSITTSELLYGANKSQQVQKNLKRVEEFLFPFDILPYDERASFYYGEIRADLEKKGKIIGPLDMLIAAHALSLGVILVTNNTKEFERIAGLKLENWVLE